MTLLGILSATVSLSSMIFCQLAIA
uniref:Uncharacterized protein n=1 Tax=Arundo donax TaxID=35708 RepID=A0A0A9GM43_ARUDO